MRTLRASLATLLVASVAANADLMDPIFQYDAVSGVMRVIPNGHFITDLVVTGPDAPSPVSLLPTGLTYNSRGDWVVWMSSIYPGKFKAYDGMSNGQDNVFDLARYLPGLGPGHFSLVEWGGAIAGGPGECGFAAVTIGPLLTLYWDGADPAEWTSAHWGPGPFAPTADRNMLVNSGTVTVSSDLTAMPAASLAIGSGAPGGTVSIGPAGEIVVTDRVTVGPRGTLSIDGVLSAGAVTVTGGSVTNSVGRIGPMTVNGSVALAAGATLAVEAIGAGLDKLANTGTATLGANVTLDIMFSGGGNEFAGGTYTLIEAAGGLSGTFANVTDLGVYASVNGNGLTYDEAGGTVTLTLDMNLHPGDANLNGATEVLDRIIWNNHRFTEGTTFVTGDFNGDGATDVSDRIIWNSHRFTWATATPGALGATAVPIPEPATLSLLALVGLAMLRRRRRQAGTGQSDGNTSTKMSSRSRCGVARASRP